MSDMHYWLSWYQPTNDYRPLTDPPHPAVLGWWNSGQRCSDDAWTLCALVEAYNEDQAKACIQISWPEAVEWRFCEAKPFRWLPGDRFPIDAEWMRRRIKDAAGGGGEG